MTEPIATIQLGDCRHIIAELPDSSIDSIVTDPPYELGFMGKAWDGSGIAYDIELWRQCLRVLKPGGHLLAFGGTRTYHRMAVAIEDAGFEIRDSIHWLYGSGFPKSLDVSKAIDKAAGAERERVPYTGGIASGSGNYGGGGTVHVGTKVGPTPATDAARQWEGWGTALKPAHEPILVARKPLSGTVAATVLEHGTGALNIDACRIAHGGDIANADGGGQGAGPEAHNHDGRIFGNGLGGIVAEPHAAGRWPANLVLTHHANCADDCATGCPVAELDQQSGVSKSQGGRIGKKEHGSVAIGGAGNFTAGDPGFGDTGGASRFFTVTEWDPIADAVPFRYTPKPSRAERDAGLAANHHPTVKPLALMRWLVRLVTPPGGTILEPFAGSGTTMAAAILEGFHVIGCELTADYLPIIKGRINWAQQTRNATPPTLFDPTQ